MLTLARKAGAEVRDLLKEKAETEKAIAAERKEFYKEKARLRASRAEEVAKTKAKLRTDFAARLNELKGRLAEKGEYDAVKGELEKAQDVLGCLEILVGMGLPIPEDMLTGTQVSIDGYTADLEKLQAGVMEDDLFVVPSEDGEEYLNYSSDDAVEVVPPEANEVNPGDGENQGQAIQGGQDDDQAADP